MNSEKGCVNFRENFWDDENKFTRKFISIIEVLEKFLRYYSYTIYHFDIYTFVYEINNKHKLYLFEWVINYIFILIEKNF